MLAYMLQRLLWLPVLLLIVSLITFALGYYGPADPIVALLGQHYDPEVAARYAERYPAFPMVTIRDFGGWDVAQAKYFADGGLFDRIFTPGR